MGKKSSPPPPDYTAAAERTAQSSRENTDAQTWANRPTVNTPWGQQSWQANQQTDPATGRPVTAWTQNITLTPQQQAALDSQQRIGQGRSNAAETLLGQATQNFQRPTDWNSFNPMFNFGMGGQEGGIKRQMSQTPGGLANQAMEATWAAQQPTFDRRRAQTESQLANMGLARGSEAWNEEAQRLNQSEDAGRLSAFQTGMGVQNQMFGQNLQADQFANQAQGQQFGQNANFQNQLMQFGGYQNQLRQQQIAEEMQRRGQPLNELNALLSGQQVNMPQQPGFQNAGRSDTTNYSGAAQNQYQGSLDRYNSGQQGLQGLLQGAGSIGSMAMMFSDARLKDVLGPLTRLRNGLRVWLYYNRLTKRLEAGLIAQEVAAVRPAAVAVHPSGYLMINYTMATE